MDITKAKATIEELNKVLLEFGKKHDMTFQVAAIHYSDVNVSAKVTLTEVGDNGEMQFTENDHKMANLKAEMSGIKFQGNLLGSKWMIKDACYMVVGFKSKAGKYPYVLQKLGEQRYKVQAGFIKNGYQLVKPTIEEFETWLETDDIEDDRISREDEAAFNKTNEWITYLSEENSIIEKVYDLINDKIDNILKYKKNLKAAYAAVSTGNSGEIINVLSNI